MAKYLVTDIGALTLKAMLTHPLLNSDLIHERQEAIHYLADHPELRNNIRELLRSLQSAGASETPKDFETLRERNPMGAKSPAVLSTIAAFVWGATAGYLGFHPEDVSQFGQLLLPMVYVTSWNFRSIENNRSLMKPLKSLVAMAEKIDVDLKATSHRLLQKIGNTLSAVKDAKHPLQLATVSRTIRAMVTNEVLTYLGSSSFLINGPTHVLAQKILKNQESLEVLLTTIADLDVLAGTAELLEKNRETYRFPEILPQSHSTYLKITGGHHPYVLDQQKEGSVGNDVEMATATSGVAPGFLLLTGPNTGGKSTYLRTLAANAILAQIGSPVPAEKMTLTPLAIITNMNVQDALDKKQSFFYAQADRVNKILSIASAQPHVFIIMDEILNGTSPEEHTGIERGIIKYLVNSNYLSILATHDRKLQSLEQEISGVVNIHVDDKSRDTFKVKMGPSLNRNAIDVIGEVGFPAAIIDEARNYLQSVGIGEKPN